MREDRPIHGGGPPLVAARTGLAAQEVVLEDAHARLGLRTPPLAGGEECVVVVAAREFGGVSRAGRVEDAFSLKQSAVGAACKTAANPPKYSSALFTGSNTTGVVGGSSTTADLILIYNPALGGGTGGFDQYF